MLKRNPNPYAGIDWKKQIRVQGCTHLHCNDAQTLRKVLEQGLEFVTLSNYYPSLPYWPLASMRRNSAQMSLPNYVRHGKLVMEKLDLRRFCSDLGEDVSEIPAEPGERIFPDLPPGILEAPNAEHHYFSDTNVYLHLTAPGCSLCSGRPRFKNEFFERSGIVSGFGLTWKEAFRALIDALIVPDGGGIIINHPQWSHHPINFLCEMLDFDERVLGMEVVNTDCRVSYTAGAEPQWDAVLSTGRQCWGFCAQDHMQTPELLGRSILLPEERTMESCLRAYRQGRFYGAIRGKGLKFESIEFDGKTLRVRCDREAIILLISAQGVVRELWTGKELVYTLQPGDREKHRFLRVTARDRSEGEKLYTQPIMLI